jgi:hypothetical protein
MTESENMIVETGAKEEKRLRARRYFLTISKVVDEQLMNKESVRDMLLKMEESLSHYMIGRELHVDGTPHYHLYLKYSKQRELKFKHFDYLGQHGSLASCRDPIRSYMYISKEDKAPLSNFDYEAGILRGTTEEIATYMSQTGKKYTDLLRNEGRNALVTKWRPLKAFEKELEAEEKLNETIAKKTGIMYIDENVMREKLTEHELRLVSEYEELRTIIAHINQVVKFRYNRPFKTKNLLIYSSQPDTGKTSLIRKIGQHCPIYHFPRGEWFHGYKNYTFWGMLWNEVNIKGWDVENLKNMLEGTAVTLEVKGGHINKDDNPEVFMTSNYTLKEMVEERYKYDPVRCERTLKTLEARIEEVNLDDFVYKNGDIFFLQKLILPFKIDENVVKYIMDKRRESILRDQEELTLLIRENFAKTGLEDYLPAYNTAAHSISSLVEYLQYANNIRKEDIEGYVRGLNRKQLDDLSIEYKTSLLAFQIFCAKHEITDMDKKLQEAIDFCKTIQVFS